jgi:hypothetical protein
MSPSFRITGGVWIGGRSATWPFARLSASPQELTVDVALFGVFTFYPQDVVIIERIIFIPVIAWGIRIRHSHRDYPQRFIFWSVFTFPSTITDGIRAAGFVPTSASHAGI